MRYQVVCIFIFFSSLNFANYTDVEFKKDFLSPYQNETGQKFLIYGAATALTLILTEDAIEKPFQEFMSEEEPLGELAPIGDLMGRMAPNIAYVGYHFYKNNPDSKRRALLMTRVSLFAGGTTFFLKRAFNQKRPDSNDRNSFPSGHTTTAFAFASVIDREHPEYRWWGYGLAGLVGISRVNDNAHYLHDVAMGAAIGMAYGYTLKSDYNISFTPVGDGLNFKYSVLF